LGVARQSRTPTSTTAAKDGRETRVTMNPDLMRAIEAKHLVEFDYSGRRRIVEPHDYGIRGGQETLLGYQLSGGSESGIAHGWKEFKLAKLARLRVLERHFPGSRGDGAQQHRTWDTLFARVS
jgi:predicted DNA-binding transcriptional regulator YafY